MNIEDKGDFYKRHLSLLVSGDIESARDLLNGAPKKLAKSIRLECEGNTHFYLHEFQKAADFYEAAMSSDSEYDVARYHYLVGLQEEKSNQLVEAFKRYQAAIEIEPAFIDTYLQLGQLLYKVEDYNGSLKCFQDALNLAPREVGIYHNIVEVVKAIAAKNPDKYGGIYKQFEKAYEDVKSSRL